MPPFAIVVGNPARVIGYNNDVRRKGDRVIDIAQAKTERASQVSGVRLVPLKVVTDPRGDLMVGEFNRQVPFDPKRFFIVYRVPSMNLRGEHAHKECHQFLICISGSCSVVVDDGTTREEFRLSDPGTGIYMPPLTWGTQYKYSADAILLVFASHAYDAGDYLRTYDEFTRFRAINRA